MTATLTLSPTMLHWAASRIGWSLNDLAEEIVAPSKVKSFLEGKLTPRQAEKVATATRVPFGYLFLDSPPKLERPKIPDLRQLPSAEPLSDRFFETLEDIERKQYWAATQLHEVDAAPPSFVGKFKGIGKDAKAVSLVAADIVSVLKLTQADRIGTANPEAYYSLLSDRIEDAGAFVFKSGIVGSNTHRPLSVDQFRGFAIADALVPAIFVNGRDFPSAWVFTLLHEAAHLWLGESGVSDVSATTESSQSKGLEALCNQVAAEVLTPRAEFEARWHATSDSKLLVLSRAFRVSQLVIARRALDFGYITRQAYLDAAEIAKQLANKEGSGGNPYNTIPVRNSKRFTSMLVASAMSGETMLRDASSFLNVSPDTVAELGRR